MPSNATGDIELTPTKLVLNAGGLDVPCTVNGAPKLGKLPVDAGATPPPTTTPPTTEPPGTQGPPNGKEVTIEYKCKTVVEGFPIEIPDTTPTYAATITVASTAKKGDKLDISAKFKDNVVGQAPASLPMDNIELTFTPTFKVDVEEGSNKKSIDLTAPAKTITVNKGDALILDGPVTGKFDVWGGGDFTFKPGELKVATSAKVGTLNAKSTTTCSVTKTTVSATLKATGDQGTPPANSETPSQTLSQTPTGNNNPGDLANTGAEGDGMTAFAMAAGTAVLGAIALMLFVPYRRRMRNQI